MLKEDFDKLSAAIAALPELADFVSALATSSQADEAEFRGHLKGIAMFKSGHCDTSAKDLAFWAAIGVIEGYEGAVSLHEDMVCL